MEWHKSCAAGENSRAQKIIGSRQTLTVRRSPHRSYSFAVPAMRKSASAQPPAQRSCKRDRAFVPSLRRNDPDQVLKGPSQSHAPKLALTLLVWAHCSRRRSSEEASKIGAGSCAPRELSDKADRRDAPRNGLMVTQKADFRKLNRRRIHPCCRGYPATHAAGATRQIVIRLCADI